MSVASPRSTPDSMQRRTRPTMNSRTERPASFSSGPGSKSAKGLENMTAASTGWPVANKRSAPITATRSARVSEVSWTAPSRPRSMRNPSKKTSRTSPALSPKSS